MTVQNRFVRLGVLVGATGLAIAVGVGLAMQRHFAGSEAPAIADGGADLVLAGNAPAQASAAPKPRRVAAALGERPRATPPPEGTETRLDQLEGLVRDVAREQRQLAAVIARLAEDEAQAGPQQDPPLGPAERAALADRQSLDQASLVSETHLEEAVDPGWAPQAQQSVHAMFANEALEGFTLTSADCRASMCRIEMGVEEAIAGPEAFRKLQQNTPWNGAGFVEITLDPPGAVLYLAREGASIPDLDERGE